MSIFINIIILIATIAVCFVGAYFILRPQIKSRIQQDNKLLEEQRSLQEKNNQLYNENEALLCKNNDLTKENLVLAQQKDSLYEQIDDIKDNIKSMEDQAQQAAEIFFRDKKEIARQNFEESLMAEKQNFEESMEHFQLEYKIIINDLLEEIQKLEGQICVLRSNNDAAVEAAKRALEIKEKSNFYRIQLSDIDKKEIEMLREVGTLLRDKEPLNKVIWKYYYEKLTTDLIGRVVGANTRTGIYKITNVNNSMCYIGQAANIADRFRQHIKRGLGAETPTRIKLYSAMFDEGPENFTFEIIEDCERAKLDEKERYWIEFYRAMEFGYNMRCG